MADAELRAILAEFIDADEEEREAVFARNEALFLSEAAVAELEAWIGEETDPETGSALRGLRHTLSLNRAGRSLTAEEGEALAKQLTTWLETPDWGSSKAFLLAHRSQLVTYRAEVVLLALRANNPNSVAIFDQHITILNRSLEEGVEAAYRPMQEMDPEEQLLQTLLATDDGEALTALVRISSDQLLDDMERVAQTRLGELTGGEAERLGRQLADLRQIRAGTGPEDKIAPFEMLWDAFMDTRGGVDMQQLVERLPAELLDDLEGMAAERLAAAGDDEAEAIQQRLNDLRALRHIADSPLIQVITRFLNAEDDREAEEILAAEASLLLTVDAQNILDGLTANEESRDRLERRRAMWEQAWLNR
jgi:hypothetical protein